jgi:hypothetical protein
MTKVIVDEDQTGVPCEKFEVMTGKLNSLEIEEVLSKQMIGRIGCLIDGRIHIIPVSYGYDGEHIYWLAPEGMNVGWLRKNSQICLETELMQDLGNWKSVTIWGTFTELPEPVEVNHALSLLSRCIHADISGCAAKMNPEWPFISQEKTHSREGLYSIKIERKSGHFEVFQSEGSRVHV